MQHWYKTMIDYPVERWFLRSLDGALLNSDEQRSLRHQAVIGWLQTILLIVVLIQVIFAGLLRALPPNLRATLGFLHRIEWGAYLGIGLILAQVAAGWSEKLVLTNRYGILAWRFSRPRLVRGQTARILQLLYVCLVFLITGAIIWVRIHGFIVQPQP